MLEAEDPGQLPGLVHHVGFGEVFDFLRLLPDALEHLLHGLIVPHHDQGAGHQAAGGLVVVAEETLNLLPFLGVHRRQNPPLLFRFEFAEDVGRVVVRHLFDDAGGLFRGEGREGILGVLPLRHLDERLAGEVGRKQLGDLDALVVVGQRQDVGEIHRLQHAGPPEEFAHPAVPEQLDHPFRRERVPDHGAVRSSAVDPGDPRRTSSCSIRVGDARTTSSSRPRTRNRSPLIGSRPASSANRPPRA